MNDNTSQNPPETGKPVTHHRDDNLGAGEITGLVICLLSLSLLLVCLFLALGWAGFGIGAGTLGLVTGYRVTKAAAAAPAAVLNRRWQEAKDAFHGTASGTQRDTGHDGYRDSGRDNYRDTGRDTGRDSYGDTDAGVFTVDPDDPQAMMPKPPTQP